MGALAGLEKMILLTIRNSTIRSTQLSSGIWFVSTRVLGDVRAQRA